MNCSTRWTDFLALYAVECLAPHLCSNPQFQELARRLDSAEEYIQSNSDVFLSAAVYASTLFDAYRQNLFEFDEKLWETTLKYRCLQELVDEQENPIRPLPLSEGLAKEVESILPCRVVRLLTSGRWAPIEVDVPDSAQGLFLETCFKIEISSEMDSLLFWMRSDPKVSQTFNWIVENPELTTVMCDNQDQIRINGDWQNSSLPFRVSIKFGAKEVPVVDLKLECKR